ncbi:MAG TPA: redox-sensing transcriptional repressor Rex, partial [Pseudonocardiaceae bacterium]
METAGQPAASVDVPAARERARAIPEATVARLAVYLRVLIGRAEDGVPTLSSEELAHAAGVNSAKLRKDLSYLGSYGTRGVGYDVEILIGEIERTLGLTRKHSVAVVGIGNLGHALAGYSGFASRGFPVAALFDVDEDLIGIRIAG